MKFVELLGAIGKKLNTVLEKVAFVFFVAMTLIVWAQIFYRYVLGDGIIWAEEISKYLMVWMALLAAAIVYHDKGHISMQFFADRIQAQRLLAAFQILAGSVLFVALIVFGFEYAQFGKRFISPASGLQRFWPYLAIPIGGIFLFFYSIIHFVELLYSSNDAKEGDVFPETERTGTEE